MQLKIDEFLIQNGPDFCVSFLYAGTWSLKIIPGDRKTKNTCFVFSRSALVTGFILVVDYFAAYPLDCADSGGQQKSIYSNCRLIS